jgi:putative N6-adenine-specific DNA methylase
MYQYQKTNRYFAQTADDITDITEEEIKSLGATETKLAYRGIYFTADQKTLYTINFHSRLINRILAPIISFKCHSDRYLYKIASQIKWEDFFDPTQTFAVFSSVSHSRIRHSKFAALRLKDAVVDYFRTEIGERPSIDTRNPDLWLNIHIEHNEAIISLDTSGGSLHRRGYRKKTIEAPMIETLAATILKYAGWDGRVELIDPFCGSGTLLCEAYMIASLMPASILRKNFGFEKLPDFDAKLWEVVKIEGLKKIKPIKHGLISGSDIASETVKSVKLNCAQIDRKRVIDITQKNIFDIESIENKMIVCNPPYGIRMGGEENLSQFYKRLGDFLKKRCHGSTAYIYFGDRKYLKNIGLKASWKKPLSNGGLDGRLAKFELY